MLYVMKLAIFSKESLSSHPRKVELTENLKVLGFDVISANECGACDGADCLLVFGGDGTMLTAATTFDLPILGVNLGNVGFLTQFESSVTAEDIAKAVKCGKVVTRSLIETEVEDTMLVALNDLTVKSTTARPITLSVSVDGQFVDKYHADGIIVSTPTGSTAYSLSAGGPVLAPDVDAMVINPICPHSLHSRTLVVSGNSTVEITVDDEGAVVFTDSESCANVTNTIKIKKSSKTARFIDVDKRDFYNKLLEKMNRWGTTC